MNFNKAIVAGNLTRDPEARNLPSGQMVVNFGLATNRVWVDQSGNKQESAEFHNIVAFGKLAEICSRYLTKGRLVLIEGRIQTRSWQGQDGVKKYRTEIVADNMQMGPRWASGGAGAGMTGENKTSLPAQPTAVNQEEIPVIEADEPVETENKIEDNSNPDEINVKNIPF